MRPCLLARPFNPTLSASLLYVSTILGVPFCSHYSSAEFLSNVSPAVNQQPIKQSAKHRAVTFLWRLLPNWPLLTQSLEAATELATAHSIILRLAPPLLASLALSTCSASIGRFHFQRFRVFRCLMFLLHGVRTSVRARSANCLLGTGYETSSSILQPNQL